MRAELPAAVRRESRIGFYVRNGPRISQQLRVDEPVLRAALRKAADERRSDKNQPELIKGAKPMMAVDPHASRRKILGGNWQAVCKGTAL